MKNAERRSMKNVNWRGGVIWWVNAVTLVSRRITSAEKASKRMLPKAPKTRDNNLEVLFFSLIVRMGVIALRTKTAKPSGKRFSSIFSRRRKRKLRLYAANSRKALLS